MAKTPIAKPRKSREFDDSASVASISSVSTSISHILKISVEKTINSFKENGRAKKYDPANSKRDSPKKDHYHVRRGKSRADIEKISKTQAQIKKKPDNKFHATWLESQKGTRRKKRRDFFILMFLWLSVAITFVAKPWKHVSQMKERKIRNKMNLENIRRSEQSHILLCRALIELDSANNRPKEMDGTMVIEEDRRVCLDRSNPHSSLLQIFASSLIAQATKHLRLEYRHKCNPRDSLKGSSTSSSVAAPYTSIQETLRSNLLFNTPLEINDVKELCQGCINAMEEDNEGNFFFSGPECILFPTMHNSSSTFPSFSSQKQEDNIAPSVQVFETILPSITKNLYESADQWFLTTASDVTNIMREAYEVKNITTMIDPNKHEDAIIYLSCAREHNRKKDCDVHAIPYYVYVKEIPPTVDQITVLASTSCASFSSSCADYGRNMQKFLNDWYPRSKVTFEISQSTAMSYSRMIRTSYLICAESVSCLLPALTNDGYATLLENPTYFPWLKSLKKDFVANVNLLPSSIPLEYTRSVTKEFLLQNPKSRIENCKELRGRKGIWQQDFEYATMSQYKLPLAGYAGAADINFQPSKKQIFRSPTTYKWTENVFPTCNVEYLTLDKLCATLDVMMISRIFILGDSLSLQMVQSLWKLLGHLDNYTGDRDSIASRRVKCPAPYHVDFEIAFARNDRLLDVETGPAAVDDKNCQYGYCWPFVERYKASPDRTLLIANTGAHSHQHSIFYKDFDTFIELVDSFERPNDLVWFRTSVPGHKDCDAKNLVPFKNYAEYEPTITEVYSWDKFIDYNDYASRVIRQREKEGNYRGPRIDILDVYPMTILRPDGHAGGADCFNCGRDDCLHYSLPGPVDWWNHLMLSNLVDTASRG